MDKSFADRVKENVVKILRDRNLSQAVMAEYAGTSPSQFSKILSGQVKLTLEHIANIASALEMSEIDIITYPEVYVKKSEAAQEPVEAIIQIKLQNSKKDEVLRAVFGDANLEILK